MKSNVHGTGKSRWLPLAVVVGTVLGTVVGGGAIFRNRLGRQPARPLAVIVSGDTSGWIVPCGCTTKQAGGLLRRATLVDKVRTASDVVLADAGGAPGGTTRYDQLKFAALCRGEVEMGIDAHNLGAAELSLGTSSLSRVAADTHAPFVSANAVDRSNSPIVSASRVVTKGAARIGIVGVVSPRYATDEIIVNDPREAALREIGTLRKDCAVIVVLAYLPEEELEAFASSLPEADLVVGGPTRQSISPRSAGPTLWGSATSKGKFLVQMNSSPSASKWTGEVVEVSDQFQDDERQKQNLRQFYDELQRLDLSASETSFAQRLPADIPADFRIVGTEACRKCHTADCAQWDSTRHSHAWKTLVEKQSEMDSYCQQCHTTGYGLPDGFVSLRQSQHRVNVGCESCHGPSQAHAANPKTRTAFDAADRCVRCHDRENDPNFAYADFWPQIEHGQKVSE